MITNTYNYRPNIDNKVSAGFDPCVGLVDVSLETYAGGLSFWARREDLEGILDVLSAAYEDLTEGDA